MIVSPAVSAEVEFTVCKSRELVGVARPRENITCWLQCLSVIQGTAAVGKPLTEHELQVILKTGCSKRDIRSVAVTYLQSRVEERQKR